MSSDIPKTDNDWRLKLTKEQFYVLREKGTERPFTGKYDDHFEKGVYSCAGCDAPLFKSDHKFHSGCGWPAFFDSIPGAVKRNEDRSVGMVRTEIVCAKCGGHLGHVFKGEGYKTPTDERHCVNNFDTMFPNKLTTLLIASLSIQLLGADIINVAHVSSLVNDLDAYKAIKVVGTIFVGLKEGAFDVYLLDTDTGNIRKDLKVSELLPQCNAASIELLFDSGTKSYVLYFSSTSDSGSIFQIYNISRALEHFDKFNMLVYSTTEFGSSIMVLDYYNDCITLLSGESYVRLNISNVTNPVLSMINVEDYFDNKSLDISSSWKSDHSFIVVSIPLKQELIVINEDGVIEEQFRATICDDILLVYNSILCFITDDSGMVFVSYFDLQNRILIRKDYLGISENTRPFMLGKYAFVAMKIGDISEILSLKSLSDGFQLEFKSSIALELVDYSYNSLYVYNGSALQSIVIGSPEAFCPGEEEGCYLQNGGFIKTSLSVRSCGPYTFTESSKFNLFNSSFLLSIDLIGDPYYYNTEFRIDTINTSIGVYLKQNDGAMKESTAFTMKDVNSHLVYINIKDSDSNECKLKLTFAAYSSIGQLISDVSLDFSKSSSICTDNSIQPIRCNSFTSFLESKRGHKPVSVVKRDQRVVTSATENAPHSSDKPNTVDDTTFYTVIAVLYVCSFISYICTLLLYQRLPKIQKVKRTSMEKEHKPDLYEELKAQGVKIIDIPYDPAQYNHVNPEPPSPLRELEIPTSNDDVTEPIDKLPVPKRPTAISKSPSTEGPSKLKKLKLPEQNDTLVNDQEYEGPVFQTKTFINDDSEITEKFQSIVVPKNIRFVYGVDFVIEKSFTSSRRQHIFIGTPINSALTAEGNQILIKRLGDNVNSIQSSQGSSGFYREIAVLNHLKNEKNIATILGYCREPACILLKYYQFGSLHDWIRSKSGKKTKRFMLKFSKDVASGISAIKKFGFVHGDIKPRNIFLDVSGKKSMTAILTDFEEAILIPNDDQAPIHVETKYSLSSAFASPEFIACFQAKKIELTAQILFSADVYSVGMLMSCMLRRKNSWS